MMAIVKFVLLLLVVFKASALKNSEELSSYSSSSPIPYPPTSDIEQEKISKALCIVGCAFTCLGKPSFLKGICMGVCLAKCVLNPSDSLSEIICTVDCAQSSTNTLSYDANMINDLGHSCYHQCKKE